MHGGRLRLLDAKQGAAFVFEIPDRGTHQAPEAAAVPVGPEDAA